MRTSSPLATLHFGVMTSRAERGSEWALGGSEICAVTVATIVCCVVAEDALGVANDEVGANKVTVHEPQIPVSAAMRLTAPLNQRRLRGPGESGVNLVGLLARWGCGGVDTCAGSRLR
uniref:Predicted protein n=1 Tax=Physcomitrium patens TaxID=3218 RepID=A9TMF3_PHYPA